MEGENRITAGDAKKGVSCPYCHGSRVVVTRDPDAGEISVQCSRCGKFYTIDFKTMKAKKSQAIKNEELISSKK